MNTNKRKKILVAAMLAVMMAVPMGLDAQSDGFFSGWHEIDRNEDLPSPGGVNSGTFGWDGTDSGVNNESFVAPLGGGLLILAASAAGYAVLRKRKVES